MNIRASGRAALVIAAGLLVCASGALHATESDAQSQASEPAATVGSATDTSAQPAKATRHHGARKSAAKSRKSDRLTSKGAKKAADEETAKADEARPDHTDAVMPTSVANANAQWPSETPATNTYNMTSQASGVLSQIGGQQEQSAKALPDAGAGNPQVVAADQLNDLDRAITDDKPALTLAKATIDPPAPEVTVSQDSTTWDKTSLVGKIFIAFGGLLTMASAARMFIA